MSSRDSFKRIHSCQSSKCLNTLSVLYGFLPNVIISLHILDTEIFALNKNIKIVYAKWSQVLAPTF